jgi:hypothetical protein
MRQMYDSEVFVLAKTVVLASILVVAVPFLCRSIILMM